MEPAIARQDAFVAPPMLPPSWADLAEDDPEMMLMGPPMVAPAFVPTEWFRPKAPGKVKKVPQPQYIETRNQFHALMAQLADEVEVSEPGPSCAPLPLEPDDDPTMVEALERCSVREASQLPTRPPSQTR